MADFSSYSQIGVQENEKQKFLSRTYAWMGLALLLSAASAFATASSITLMKMLFGNGSIGFIILAVGEIALVWWLSASIRKISVASATIGYVVYALINGMTLSSIFYAYSIASIGYCFVSASAMFFVMALYGAKTKKNLNTMARYLMMALFGVIIASVVQLVISLITKQPLAVLDMLISFVTVIIFTGLTAYDSQRLLMTAEHSTGSDDYKKIAIIAALELYLDFINIFLSLLRLFGKRR
jgi:FtsH-binding integral membrane protein